MDLSIAKVEEYAENYYRLLIDFVNINHILRFLKVLLFLVIIANLVTHDC